MKPVLPTTVREIVWLKSIEHDYIRIIKVSVLQEMGSSTVVKHERQEVISTVCPRVESSSPIRGKFFADFFSALIQFLNVSEIETQKLPIWRCHQCSLDDNFLSSELGCWLPMLLFTFQDKNYFWCLTYLDDGKVVHTKC